MAVEPSFYAAMDNHLHVLLRNRPDLVQRWSDEEVIRRACRPFVYKFQQMGVEDQQPRDEQLQRLVQDEDLVKTMRARLSSISWLMRCLCERIAKRCNDEDGVTGHFCELLSRGFACGVPGKPVSCGGANPRTRRRMQPNAAPLPSVAKRTLHTQ